MSYCLLVSCQLHKQEVLFKLIEMIKSNFNEPINGLMLFRFILASADNVTVS